MNSCVIKQAGPSEPEATEFDGCGPRYSVSTFLAEERHFSFVWMHYNDFIDYRIEQISQEALRDKVAGSGGRLLFFTRASNGKPDIFLGETVIVHPWTQVKDHLNNPDVILAQPILLALNLACQAFLIAHHAELCRHANQAGRDYPEAGSMIAKI